jgi:CBS domain containing-hemolysin-like protein
MEDVIEHLLGKEIYEETDVAIDMRELARRKARRWSGQNAGDSSKQTDNTPRHKPEGEEHS